MTYKEFGIYSSGSTIFVATEIINEYILGFYIPQWDIEEFTNSFVRKYVRNNYETIEAGLLSIRNLEENEFRIIRNLGYLGQIEEDKKVQEYINNLFQKAQAAGWDFFSLI